MPGAENAACKMKPGSVKACLRPSAECSPGRWCWSKPDDARPAEGGRCLHSFAAMRVAEERLRVFSAEECSDHIVFNSFATVSILLESMALYVFG